MKRYTQATGRGSDIQEDPEGEWVEHKDVDRLITGAILHGKVGGRRARARRPRDDCPGGRQPSRLARVARALRRGQPANVAEGLTLTASGALVGVTRRTLAAWVRLADDRRAPWAAWFDTLVRQDANSRRQVLRELHKLAANDPCARRDFLNQRGRLSKLEYEIEGLRRSKTAAMDALVMPSDADRNRGAGKLDDANGNESREGGTR